MGVGVKTVIKACLHTFLEELLTGSLPTITASNSNENRLTHHRQPRAAEALRSGNAIFRHGSDSASRRDGIAT
ncbi:hypothetical protein BSZ32_05910 [Rubritalea profundi]|uniref:Uncharacterized protein n=1 Tax=Rubritalea profundi TaxID=1658618 RepID=A0A2S7U116_9BACT|nr:hypothetical protein BSZ32_05910 [Rubritalea profundi]